jgi:integrase
VQRLKREKRATIPRPYDLRHSFISLLLREGASVVEVARQAGHAPTMSLDTYGHVIAELECAERKSAEAMISAARETLVPSTYPRKLRAASSSTP